MPKKKQPLSAFQLSLRRAAKTIVEGCKNNSARRVGSRGIKEFARKIPPSLANAYMVELIGILCQEKEWPKGVELRDAFHPDCTRMPTLSEKYEHTELRLQVLQNLDIMPNLEILSIRYLPTRETQLAKEILSQKILHLKNLVSVDIANACSVEIATQIVQNCSHLEEFSASHSTFSSDDVRIFANCTHLKMVYLGFKMMLSLTSSDYNCMLNSLTQLEILEIWNLGDVLEHCHQKYPLRCLIGDTYDSRSQDKLVACFPLLESLEFKYVTQAVSMRPLNELSHLKKLVVQGLSSDNLDELTSDCFYRLTELCLLSCDSLAYMFDEKAALCFPKMRKVSFSSCTMIDLCRLALVFPNLHSLHMNSCKFLQITSENDLTVNQFQQLQDLATWGCSSSQNHLCFLLSHCKDLTTLTLNEKHFLNKEFLHVLIRSNPMKKLHSLTLGDNQVIVSLIPLLEFFDNLEVLNLSGLKWKEIFHPHARSELKKSLLMYDIHITVCYENL